MNTETKQESTYERNLQKLNKSYLIRFACCCASFMLKKKIASTSIQNHPSTSKSTSHHIDINSTIISTSNDRIFTGTTTLKFIDTTEFLLGWGTFVHFIYSFVLILFLLVYIGVQKNPIQSFKILSSTYGICIILFLLTVMMSIFRSYTGHFTFAALLTNIYFLQDVCRQGGYKLEFIGRSYVRLNVSLVLQWLLLSLALLLVEISFDGYLMIGGLLLTALDFISSTLRFTAGNKPIFVDEWKECPLINVQESIESSGVVTKVYSKDRKPDGLFALSYRWEDENKDGFTTDNLKVLLNLATADEMKCGFLDFQCKWPAGYRGTEEKMATLDVNKTVYSKADQHYIFVKSDNFRQMQTAVRFLVWSYASAFSIASWICSRKLGGSILVNTVFTFCAIVSLWLCQYFISLVLFNETIPGAYRVWLRLEYECRRNNKIFRNRPSVLFDKNGAYLKISFSNYWGSSLQTLLWVLFNIGYPVCILPDRKDLSNLSSRGWGETIDLIDQWTNFTPPNVWRDLRTQDTSDTIAISRPELQVVGGDIVYWFFGAMYRYNGNKAFKTIAVHDSKLRYFMDTFELATGPTAIAHLSTTSAVIHGKYRPKLDRQDIKHDNDNNEESSKTIHKYLHQVRKSITEHTTKITSTTRVTPRPSQVVRVQYTQGKFPENVVVKLFSDAISFKKEYSIRNELDNAYVLPVLASYCHKDEDFTNHLTILGYEKFGYALVFPRCRTLHQILYDSITLEDTYMMILIFKDLLRCVSHVHERGYIHGDLKPRNIICDDFRRVKLIDFDSSVRVGSGATVSQKYSSLYSPPELFFVNEDNTIATDMTLLAHFSYDIWSLGVILFHICAKISLFQSMEIYLESPRDNMSVADMLKLSKKWSDDPIYPLKSDKLQKINDRNARALISKMLSNISDMRPSSARILQDAYFNNA